MRAISIALLLISSGCEFYVTVEGRTFGTSKPCRAGIEIVDSDEGLKEGDDVWVLDGAEILYCWGMVHSDESGFFEVTCPASNLLRNWGIGCVAPGYREESVDRRWLEKDERIRIVLLRQGARSEGGDSPNAHTMPDE